MKSKRKDLYFMFGILILVFGLLTAIGLISSHEEKKVNESLPTFDEYDEAYTDEVDGLDYENQPMIGSETAPVKVVEFGDYKCGHCATWEKTVFPSLYENYVKTGKVQFYFVNWQFLNMDSVLAGIAGEVIYQQNNDSFWQYYQKLYENQGLQSKVWATESFLLKFVKENVEGIDYKEFEKEFKSRKAMGDVRKDYLIGKKYGVSGTPSILVNEKLVESDYQSISNAIDVELEKVN